MKTVNAALFCIATCASNISFAQTVASSYSGLSAALNLNFTSMGVKASGGAKLHTIRFGLLPQVAPVLIGQCLYFFESNTRSATIIGIVGAGGIGLELSEMIRTLEWQKVAFLIIMILITVSIIDRLSTMLRSAIAGNRVTQT